MNVQLYVDGALAYDNRLPEEKGYNVLSIAIDETVNKGGTATVILPPNHPAYDRFSPFRVPVEIYRDGKLRWRGRPVPPTKKDAYLRKTIVCEGELCFLQDAIHRPYSYDGTSADVFSQVIDVYNAAVEPWKRFAVGNVTMTGDVALSSKNPENVLETVQRLIEIFGGYIFFDSAEDGSRRINWYKDFPYTCNQTVCYGYNLTNPTSQTEESDFATRIIPYGAAGEDGVRITINIDGRDYVENAEAVAEHGVIERYVIYNDIADPKELQSRAESDVAVSGLIPAVIQMNAIDMSRQDLSLDAFAVGQQVPAESAPHKLSGSYFLMSLSEDLVNPQVGKITLMRELASISGGPVRTLTGAIAVSRKGLLSSANSNANLAAIGAVKNQTQEFIFNKLTNNGALQGLYMLDGQLYVNASYLKSGVLDASLIKAGVLSSADGKIVINLNGGASGPVFNTGISTNGVTVRGDKVGAPVLFRVNVEEVNGTNTAYLSFYDVNGNEIISLTEDMSQTGGGVLVSSDNNTLQAITQATRDSSGFRLLLNGATKAYLGMDSTGFSALACDSVNPGKKELFDGSISSGSTFTVPNTKNYDLFAIRLGNDSGAVETAVLAYKVNNKIYGIGGWCGTQGDGSLPRQLFYVTATFSDDTWTLVDAGVNDISTTGTVSAGGILQVKRIIGII